LGEFNLTFLAIGAVAVVVGALALRFFTANNSEGIKRISSLSAGYALIIAVLGLWGLGFILLGAGAGLNSNITAQLGGIV
jgi:hypothetical protein